MADDNIASKQRLTVTESNIEFAITFFEKVQREFTDTHAHTVAQATVQNQATIHRDIFYSLRPIISNPPLGQDYINSLNAFVERYVVPVAQGGQYGVSSKGGNYVVTNVMRLPVLLENDQHILNQNKPDFQSPEQALDFVALIIASYLRATEFSPRRIDQIGALGQRITAMQAVIESYLLSSQQRRKMEDSIRVKTDEVSSKVSLTEALLMERYANLSQTLEGELAKLVDKTGEITTAANLATEKSAAIESRADQLAVSIDAKLADADHKFEATDNKAKAFMDAIRTEANFNDLKIHWVDRGNSAWWALVLSSIVLFCLLVVVPLIAIYENVTVTTFIKHLTDAATVDVGQNPGPVTVAVATISRLVVITVPLALYFWLIKLVVRFNMRSMLLMDDARQRATMLETYYRMIEKGAATNEDRALVLQALMRPAPGHGPDSVEPPNFTDVLDKAMGRN